MRTSLRIARWAYEQDRGNSTGTGLLLFTALIGSAGRHIGAEEPMADVVCDGLEALVADPLAADCRHVVGGWGMTHDALDGSEVAGTLGNRLKCVPETVEGKS